MTKVVGLLMRCRFVRPHFSPKLRYIGMATPDRFAGIRLVRSLWNVHQRHDTTPLKVLMNDDSAVSTSENCAV